ncbi:hypothetical protein JD844_026406 [Phrynosoma platyrhinos]|uniref:Rho-GAP domain-containing protein n=1 Tax=Phrynosoma platyrhinos TaxID=52577 RepID=A0ABQ7SEX6_PHRPL|nr:hypothetical protein JD844_026406 [Phrynosoma platyrhinos]
MKKIAGAPMKGQRGTSSRKVFGMSLQELQHQGLSTNGIPDVVRDIVEYLTRHGKLRSDSFFFEKMREEYNSKGLKQEGLFRVNGSLKTVEQLRVKYETGEEVDLVAEGDISSAANTKQYGRNANTLRELLRQLPEAHYRLLKYLCHFLRKVTEHHSENKMNISNLATVFGPNCFQTRMFFIEVVLQLNSLKSVWCLFLGSLDLLVCGDVECQKP